MTALESLARVIFNQQSYAPRLVPDASSERKESCDGTEPLCQRCHPASQLDFRELNWSLIGGGRTGRPLFAQFGRDAQTRMVAPVGDSHYNSLQARLERRSVTASGTSLNAPDNDQRADLVKAKPEILGGIGRGHPYFENPGDTNSNNNVSNMQLNPDGSVRNLNGHAEVTRSYGERQLRLGLRLGF